MDKTMANRSLHISNCFLLLAQCFNVAGHKKVTKNKNTMIHICFFFLVGEMYQHQFFQTKILHVPGMYIHEIHAHIHTDIYTGIQTDRHTDRHTDIQTYRHTNIRTYKNTDIQTYIHRDIHTYKHTNMLHTFGSFFCEEGQKKCVYIYIFITRNVYGLKFILLLSCALGFKTKQNDTI